MWENWWIVLEGNMMYQEKETKYDGFAKKLFYDFRKTRKKKIPYWERLTFMDRDEWRGIAQVVKRERKFLKKQRKKMKRQTGDNNDRETTIRS